MTSEQEGREPSLEELREQYELACRDAIWECERFGYGAGWWKSMIRKRGAVGAAIHLLENGSDEPQSGFYRVARDLKHPEWTVEWSVLLPQWDKLFGDRPFIRETARLRLIKARVRGFPGDERVIVTEKPVSPELAQEVQQWLGECHGPIEKFIERTKEDNPWLYRRLIGLLSEVGEIGLGAFTQARSLPNSLPPDPADLDAQIEVYLYSKDKR